MYNNHIGIVQISTPICQCQPIYRLYNKEKNPTTGILKSIICRKPCFSSLQRLAQYLKSSAWHLKSSDETIGKLLEINRKAPLFSTEGSGGFIGAFRQEKSLCPFFFFSLLKNIFLFIHFSFSVVAIRNVYLCLCHPERSERISRRDLANALCELLHNVN